MLPSERCFREAAVDGHDSLFFEAGCARDVYGVVAVAVVSTKKQFAVRATGGSDVSRVITRSLARDHKAEPEQQTQGNSTKVVGKQSCLIPHLSLGTSEICTFLWHLSADASGTGKQRDVIKLYIHYSLTGDDVRVLNCFLAR